MTPIPGYLEDLAVPALREGSLAAIIEFATLVEAALWWRRNADQLNKAMKKNDHAAVAAQVKFRKDASRESKSREASAAVKKWRETPITQPLATNFAYRLLKACATHKHPPPAELVSLFRTLLKQDAPPHGYKKGAHKQSNISKANDFLRKNPRSRAADIARHAQVSSSTVHRWLKTGKLKREETVAK
jgi:hypothetical protein